MARTDFKSVDDYIAAQPEASRPLLQQVRRAIRQALPQAREVISYQIAAYKLPEGTVLFFAGWKQHYSLYPISDALRIAFKDEFTAYEVNDKGAIRFRLAEPVPVQLIERIARFRTDEVIAAAKTKKTKAAVSKKRRSSSKTASAASVLDAT